MASERTHEAKKNFRAILRESHPGVASWGGRAKVSSSNSSLSRLVEDGGSDGRGVYVGSDMVSYRLQRQDVPVLVSQHVSMVSIVAVSLQAAATDVLQTPERRIHQPPPDHGRKLWHRNAAPTKSTYLSRTYGFCPDAPTKSVLWAAIGSVRNLAGRLHVALI